MKKLLIILAAIALILLPLQDLFAVIKTNSTRAGYRLEGNANDWSGNAFNLPDCPAGPTYTTSGKFGRAASYIRASGQCLDINDNLGITSGTSITMAAWVFPTTVDGTYMVPINHTSNPSLVQTNIEISNTFTRAVRRRHGVGTDTASWGTALTVNTWYHLAVTWDGSTLRLYVNGVEQANAASSGNGTSNTSNTFSIGRYNDGVSAASNWWDGRIDEARVYNRALTSAEIRSLMLNFDPKEF